MSPATPTDQPPQKVLQIRPRRQPGQRGGRPLVPINWEAVKQARAAGCSWEEAAAVAGVDRDTLVKRAKREGKEAELTETAPALGRAIVKMKLHQVAQKGAVAALIHLDKKADAAEQAAQAAKNPAGAGNGAWIVEVPAVAPTPEAWAEQYGPMARREAE